MRSTVALVLLLLAIAGLVLLSWQDEPDAAVYVALLAGSTLTIIALLREQTVVSGRLVLAGALGAHLVAMTGSPAFEDDWFRFLWDGWRTVEAGTPYGVPPAEFFASDRIPATFQTILNGVNNPDIPTIYGPVLQYLFAVLAVLAPADPLGLKLAFAAANLAVIAILLRRHQPGQVALYAWNPLVIAETSLHLHPDGLMALAVLAAVAAGRGRPALVGLLLGAAAGVKLVALAAWPLLLRLKRAGLVAAAATLLLLYLPFLAQGSGAGFESTATFATRWHFNPLLYEPLFQLFGWDIGRLAAALIAGTIILWLHARSRSTDDLPLAGIFGAILLFAPAVNSWYLLWLLPFAVGRAQLWPWAATVALPLSYLTGLNLDDPGLEAYAVDPRARMVQGTIILAALLFDWRRSRNRSAQRKGQGRAPLPAAKVAAIIPALNEEASIGGVVTSVRAALPEGLGQVIVVDNGCTDMTAAVAQQAGAVVVRESERGYGAACLAGIARLDDDIDIVLFLDADGADVVADAPALLAPIVAGSADLVIGSRSPGTMERGAMTVPQRFGNWLAPLLVRLIWGVRYTDLGPFRAIRRRSLDELRMQDRDFGWTVEMQVRAAKLGLPVCEVPTGYRRRIGVSKISGTIQGVLKAGFKILYVIGREAFGDFDSARPVLRRALNENSRTVNRFGGRGRTMIRHGISTKDQSTP